MLPSKALIKFTNDNDRYGFTFAGSNPLATNGFGSQSPQGYSLVACLIANYDLEILCCQKF